VFGQIIAAHALGVSIAALSRSSGFSSYILSHIVKSPNYEEWRKTISNDISKFREKKEGRLSLLEQRVERLETLTQKLFEKSELLPVEISQGM
jgi:hypothetical protein